MTRSGPAPATELAERIGARPDRVRGHDHRWQQPAVAGQPGRRRHRRRSTLGDPHRRAPRPSDRPGPGGRRGVPAGSRVRSRPPTRIRWWATISPGSVPAKPPSACSLPVHVYPLFESVVAARAGHDASEHRRAMGELMAPFTEVAAANPYAWFREARTAEAIAIPSADNRLVASPTPSGCAHTSGPTRARRSSSARWPRPDGPGSPIGPSSSGRVPRPPTSGSRRPVPIPVAPRPSPPPARLRFAAASSAAGPGVGDRDRRHRGARHLLVLPVGRRAGGGRAGDRPRRLAGTDGDRRPPLLRGPGNNYTTHGIATVTDILPRSPVCGQPGARVPATGRNRVRLGMATGLGWFITKHSIGVYGADPPPAGFHRGDTTAAQSEIDASAVEVALEVDEPTRATVIAATVIRDDQGTPTGAPLLARLPDGRHMALAPADDEVTAAVGDRPTFPASSGSSICRRARRGALPSGHQAEAHRRPSHHVRSCTASDGVTSRSSPSTDPRPETPSTGRCRGRSRPPSTSSRPTTTAGWSSSPAPGTRRSARAWTSRRSPPARPATSWGPRAGSAASPNATSPSRSSPRSTGRRWPAGARSCSRATWWSPSRTPSSGSPRSSAA